MSCVQRLARLSPAYTMATPGMMPLSALSAGDATASAAGPDKTGAGSGAGISRTQASVQKTQKPVRYLFTYFLFELGIVDSEMADGA